MRRNLDFMRHLMLSIEGEKGYLNEMKSKIDEKYKEEYGEEFEEAINEHWLWLLEAEYIEAHVIPSADGYKKVFPPPHRLTYKGTESLDIIRDERVWNTTKIRTENVKSVGLEIIKKIAAGITEGMLTK